MKQMRILLMLSLCLSLCVDKAVSAASSVPGTLNNLAARLQDQLKRAGDSVRSRDEKLRDRVAGKINNFGESIEKEDVSEKVDTKLSTIQDDIQGQFDRFRVQISSLIPNAKERARVEKKLSALQNNVNKKVDSLASNMKAQSSKALQNIRKRASRLSDQVASVLDVNKEKVGRKNEQVASSKEESAVPSCDVADNNEAEQPKEKVTAS